MKLRYADSKENILLGVVASMTETNELARIIAEQEGRVIEVVESQPPQTLFTQEAMEVMEHMKKELECLHCDANMTCPDCGKPIMEMQLGGRYCTNLTCDWRENNKP